MLLTTPIKKTHAKKATPKATKAVDSFKDLLVTSLQAIRAAYPNDQWSPGLTISHLKEGDFYCSMVRYPKGWGDKTVATKAKGVDLESAVRGCMSTWVNGPDAIAKLKGML